MVQICAETLTLEQFLQQPETRPIREYMDGVILEKPMPQGKHSTIQTELATAINIALKPPKIARAWSELRCTFGGKSIVPDISVVVWERIPRDVDGKIANSFEIAPDWAIAIVSPEQGQTAIVKKILRCLDYGTQMGWLIDPQEETIFTYAPHQQPQCYDQPGQVISVPSFASPFQLTVGQLFAWLVD